jgi:hypothetical protein
MRNEGPQIKNERKLRDNSVLKQIKLKLENRKISEDNPLGNGDILAYIFSYFSFSYTAYILHGRHKDNRFLALRLKRTVQR